MTFELLKTKTSYYLRPSGIKNWKNTYRCFCGNEFQALPNVVNAGRLKSCGCIYEYHGLRSTSEYRIWSLIKDRCTNRNTPAYSRYGGRGITMCGSWLNSFTNFFEDMGPKPGPNYSIERINNNSGYFPENCKWATATEQANNRRSSRKITHNGLTKTLECWARELGVKASTIGARLRQGWTVERALNEPVKKATKV